MVGPLEFNGLDREATAVHRGCWRFGPGLFAGQFLELFKAALLIFQQAVLPVADQVLITRKGCRHHAGGGEADKQGNAQ